MNRLKQILLVDDNPHDVELALAALENHSLVNEVLVVQDGVEALEYLQRQGKFAALPDGNPVVVFLDIKLPRLSGLEVLERIKSDPALRMIPVVMLTSSREEPDLARAYQLGASGYVVKPVDFTQFADAVGKAGTFWAGLNEPPPGSLRRPATINIQ